MGPSVCVKCNSGRAVVRRPKNLDRICRDCFLKIFEQEIHETIVSSHLFRPGETIAIGASGGKDSTVLASVLKTLNERHNYGLSFVLLSVDEGIKGYRDNALETVKRNAQEYDMPLHILGYDQLYGWTMDRVVETVGKRGNCTYCGVFRRQALDRGVTMLGVSHLVTGHNADDMAETILMNILRGDLPRLSRSTGVVTGGDSVLMRRSKPLKYAYEKEIVLYAHFKKLDYFSTECIYSPEAFRGTARTLIKRLERARPSIILDIIRSGEDLSHLVPAHVAAPGCEKVQNLLEANSPSLSTDPPDFSHLEREIFLPIRLDSRTMGSDGPEIADQRRPKPYRGSTNLEGEHSKTCQVCGYMSSQAICQACKLLQALNDTR